jgi:hypothetical protein
VLSTAIKNGLSTALPEIYIFSSIAFNSASILFYPSSGIVSVSAQVADPRMNFDFAGS